MYSFELPLVAGAVLALTPVATLMFRFNNPDAMLTLCLTLGAYFTIRAIQSDPARRFASAGWEVIKIDGHDPDAIDTALTKAKTGRRPTMIACKTHIALGHAAQDTSKGHGALTDADQMAAAKEAYGWTTGPFEVPADIADAYAALRGGPADPTEGDIARTHVRN